MKILLICLPGLMAMIVGCGEEPARITTAPNVLFVDGGLAPKVEIVRQVGDRVEGDLMRVRTQMLNRTKDGLWIDIQVVWKDKNAFELYKTNWAPKLLPAGLVEGHEIVSMRSDAADYEFRIRRPVKAKD